MVMSILSFSRCGSFATLFFRKVVLRCCAQLLKAAARNNFMEGSGSATKNNDAHPKHPETQKFVVADRCAAAVADAKPALKVLTHQERFAVASSVNG